VSITVGSRRLCFGLIIEQASDVVDYFSAPGVGNATPATRLAAVVFAIRGGDVFGDHLEHGLTQGLGFVRIGLGKQVTHQLPAGFIVYFPLCDQQVAAAGKEEAFRQGGKVVALVGLAICLITDDGAGIAGGEQDPVGVEFEAADFDGGEVAVIVFVGFVRRGEDEAGFGQVANVAGLQGVGGEGDDALVFENALLVEGFEFGFGGALLQVEVLWIICLEDPGDGFEFCSGAGQWVEGVEGFDGGDVFSVAEEAEDAGTEGGVGWIATGVAFHGFLIWVC